MIVQSYSPKLMSMDAHNRLTILYTYSSVGRPGERKKRLLTRPARPMFRSLCSQLLQRSGGKSWISSIVGKVLGQELLCPATTMYFSTCYCAAISYSAQMYVRTRFTNYLRDDELKIS